MEMLPESDPPRRVGLTLALESLLAAAMAAAIIAAAAVAFQSSVFGLEAGPVPPPHEHLSAARPTPPEGAAACASQSNPAAARAYRPDRLADARRHATSSEVST